MVRAPRVRPGRDPADEDRADAERLAVRPMIDLIYCGGGNAAFAAAAVACGFRYGSRLPNTVYAPLYFADQDWRKPNRAAYMACLARFRPHMATVLDLERPDQVSTVLDWSNEAADYCDQVLIIPKYPGAIGQLPREIGRARVVLGLSVPTTHGGADVPLWEFAGWLGTQLRGYPNGSMPTYRNL